MADLLSRVIMGNIVFHPKVLREFLKKSHYFMSYKPKDESISFSVNDGSGGREIFEIRNVSHENAIKLARDLGLKGDRDEDNCIFWSKWNPVYRLYHDGGEDAEKLRMEMLKLGLPFYLVNGGYFCALALAGDRVWAWQTNTGIYMPPSWTVDMIILEIRKDAESYKEQLATKP